MVKGNCISADIIYLGNGEVLHDGFIQLGNDGMIINIGNDISSKENNNINHYKGAICPGFINAHCHLELSHLKGILPTGTGLLPFLKGVVSQRDFPIETINKAIDEADNNMYREGIVAVGDICNTIHTNTCKKNSKIEYYNFVEVFDFLQESLADEAFQKGLITYNKLASACGAKSIVPHAPYTVSNSLWKKINEFNNTQAILSIHNQETPHENQLFEDKSGGFNDFYKNFGFTIDDFQPIGHTSIHHILARTHNKLKTLFIHNTTTTKEDILAATSVNNSYFVTCPNANLFIENKLPQYKNFIETDAKLCVGTDSLSSNWQLSILEEIKTIKKYNSYLSANQLITWATFNGAEALNMNHKFGELKEGRAPGLVHLKGNVVNGEIDLLSIKKAKRIF